MVALTARMPVVYLSHGAPPLADDPLWTRQLAAWSADLPRPSAVLVVSAHWEEAPLTLGTTETVPLVYDWAERALAARDIDAVIDFLRKAPAATLAHPRTEHFAPIFVSLGASADDSSTTTSIIDGFWYGLSKRSWQFN